MSGVYPLRLNIVESEIGKCLVCFGLVWFGCVCLFWYWFDVLSGADEPEVYLLDIGSSTLNELQLALPAGGSKRV